MVLLDHDHLVAGGGKVVVHGPWLVVLTVVKTAAACRCEVAALLGCLALASTGLDLRLFPAQAWDAPIEVDGAIGVDVEIGLPVALQLGAAASSDSCTDLAGQGSPSQVSESPWGASTCGRLRGLHFLRRSFHSPGMGARN